MAFLGGLNNFSGGLNDFMSNGLSGSFTPLSLTPYVWLRSDLGITTVAGLVSQWNDQSGNGYNVSQGTSGNRPTYNTTGGASGRPRLSWSTSGSSVCLANTSFIFTPYPAEIFVVATSTVTTPAVNSFMLDAGISNDCIYQPASTSSTLGFYDSLLISEAFTVNHPFVVDACNLGNTSSFMTINGTNTVTGTVSNVVQAGHYLTIGNANGGSTNSCQGDIYEIVIFANQLSASQKSAMLSYFSQTYGIVT